MSAAFAELLAPQRLTEVVDVGANPVDGKPPYASMLAAGLCRVTGFEPQAAALRELQAAQGPNERYLPHAVGDGGAHTLHVCRASGLTSLFEPDAEKLALFEFLQPRAEVVERLPLQTRRLDDVAEIERLDFLKIDIQGGELAVFRAGRAKLSQATVVQTEVSFVPLYRGQPSVGDIDLELRGQGFMVHTFDAVKAWPIAPFEVDPGKAIGQLLEADVVYVRDLSRPDAIESEQLKHLALVVHHCYRSFDLAMRCVMLLEQRGVLATGAQQRYRNIASAASK